MRDLISRSVTVWLKTSGGRLVTCIISSPELSPLAIAWRMRVSTSVSPMRFLAFILLCFLVYSSGNRACKISSGQV